MKVLVVGHAPVRSANRTVYAALARRGLGVTLLMPDAWRSGLGVLRADPPAGDGVRVVTQPMRGRYHSNMYWYRHGIEAIAAEAGAEAIYVDEDPAGFAAAQAASVARKRRLGLVVLAIQNIYKRYPPPFGLLQRRVFDSARAAVSTSEQAAETLRRRGFAGPITAMPFATDLQPLPASERAALRAELGLDAVTVGYVGRLVKEKGVDLLLHAAAARPRIHALIVGDGPMRESLEALARELHLGDRIRFLGVVAPDRAASLIGALDALALPSRTMPNWSEQFGRVLIEAMARGVPVIASETGAIPEVVGDAGLLFPEGDAAALAACIDALCDPGRFDAIRTRGLTRVRSLYSVDAAAAALEHAFLDSVGGRS